MNDELLAKANELQGKIKEFERQKEHLNISPIGFGVRTSHDKFIWFAITQKEAAVSMREILLKDIKAQLAALKAEYEAL